MANTLIGGADGAGILDPERWTANMQLTFWNENNAVALYNMSLVDDLKEGTVLHSPYTTLSKVQTYTPGSALTATDITATDDSIVVNTTKAIFEYIDKVHTRQTPYNLQDERSMNMQRQLNNVLEQAAAANVTSANTALDDGSIGGTAGSLIVMSSSSINKIFAAAGRAMDGLRIPQANRYAKITPRALEFLRIYLGDKASAEGQEVGQFGRVMMRYGFDIYESNNVYYTATLTMPTILVDTDTITVDGVVFTADSDNGATGAGHFSIQTTVDLCRAQLTNAVNDVGTPGTDTFIQLSKTNREKLMLDGIVAANDDSADTMTITGFGDIVVAEGASPADCVWSVQTLNLEFGMKKQSINLIVSSKPQILMGSSISAGLIGDHIAGWTIYGSGVWNNHKNTLVRAKVDGSVFA